MNLESFLEKKHISRKEFASLIGVEESTVYRYIQGMRRPRDEIMCKIVDFTGGEVQPNDFYNLNHHPHTEHTHG